MSFSVLLVDYCSIEATLEYIDICEAKMKSSGEIQYFITDNTPKGIAFKYLNDNYEAKNVQNIRKYGVYEFVYKGRSVYCIPTYENIGYARGNNIAAMASMELFPDNHLLVSNNDILLDNGCNLDEIDALFAEKDYAVIGPDVLQFGQHLNPVYRHTMGYYMFLIYINTVLPKKISSSVDKNRFAFSGCFWFFNVKYFRLVDGFDDGTFMYFEEQIMEERMRAVGGEFFYYPSMQVVHNHSTKRQNTKAAIKYMNTIHASGNYFVKNYLKPNPVVYGLSNVLYWILMIPFTLERLIRDIVA